MRVVPSMSTQRRISTLLKIFCVPPSAINAKASPFDLLHTDACVLILNEVGRSEVGLPMILMLRKVCEEWRHLIDTEFETMGHRVALHGPTLRGPARFLARMNRRWQWTMEAITILQIQTLAKRVSIISVFVKTQTDVPEPMLRCMTILPQLQCLVLSDQHPLRTLDSLSGLTSLTSLTVKQCTQLTSLDAISKLDRIKVLTLMKLVHVRDVDCVTNMHDLSMVTITQCGITSDLSSLSNHEPMVCIKLRQLDSIMDLGAMVDNLPALQTLDVSFCAQLRTLGFTRTLTGLTALFLCANPLLIQLDSISLASNLRVVWVSRCKRLKRITPLALLRNLEELYIDYCGELGSVQPLLACTKLRKVDMQHCVSVPNADIVRLKQHVANTLACYPWPCSLCSAVNQNLNYNDNSFTVQR